jgi:predicted nucleic acid-binding protein
LKFILDASVYISFYSPTEVHHDQAKKLWAICPEREVFHVPQIFPLEVMSGFVRRRMDASSIGDQESFITSGPKFVIHPLSRQIISTAGAIIKSLRLRSADAIYLALTHELSGTLITLDNELANVLSRNDGEFSYSGLIVDPSLQDFDQWIAENLGTGNITSSIAKAPKAPHKSKRSANEDRTKPKP